MNPLFEYYSFYTMCVIIDIKKISDKMKIIHELFVILNILFNLHLIRYNYGKEYIW